MGLSLASDVLTHFRRRAAIDVQQFVRAGRGRENIVERLCGETKSLAGDNGDR